MKEETIFLELAKEDLNAAKCLLNQKIYHLSVFHLQQTVEKAIKSFGLYQNVISIGEAKKVIGHKAWGLYSKIFEEYEARIKRLEDIFTRSEKFKEFILKNLNWIFELRSKIQTCDKILKNFSSDDLFSISTSSEELQKIISEIKRVEEISNKLKLEEIKEENVSEYKKTLDNFLDALTEVNPNVDKNSINEIISLITPELINYIYRMAKEYIIKLYFSSLCLFYLSVVFSPHYTKSRYPEGNSNPLEIYNSNMPLVQNLEYFINLTERVISDLEYIFQFDIQTLVSQWQHIWKNY
jgi:HEPN domain-containing protein